MRLFKRDTPAKRTDKDYDESVNDRMKTVLGKDTEHEDAKTVETRLRNLNYGTNRK
jgi:hypothetical protein